MSTANKEAAIAKLQGLFNEDAESDPTEATDTETDEQAQTEPDTSSEDAEQGAGSTDADADTGNEDSSTSEPDASEGGKSEDDEGHAVPYKRFKQVIDQKNKAAEKLARMERELEALKAKAAESKSDKPEGKKSEGKKGDWIDELFGDADGGSDEDSSEGDSEIRRLSQQVEAMQIAEAERELRAEVDDARSKHPEVPESVIYKAIQQNPEMSALDVAETYSNWIATVEEQAIARHVEQNKKKAPPRPRNGSGSKGTSRNPSRPKTREEARAHMIAKLKRELGS